MACEDWKHFVCCAAQWTSFIWNIQGRSPSQRPSSIRTIGFTRSSLYHLIWNNCENSSLSGHCNCFKSCDRLISRRAPFFYPVFIYEIHSSRLGWNKACLIQCSVDSLYNVTWFRIAILLSRLFKPQKQPPYKANFNVPRVPGTMNLFQVNNLLLQTRKITALYTLNLLKVYCTIKVPPPPPPATPCPSLLWYNGCRRCCQYPGPPSKPFFSSATTNYLPPRRTPFQQLRWPRLPHDLLLAVDDCSGVNCGGLLEMEGSLVER